jgi:metal-responsive CopG/Arc/MetJ family transcriptional regulator
MLIIEVVFIATNKARYTVSVDNELFKKIEDFRFDHRFQTRSEATAELIRLGLGTLNNGQDEQKKLQK